MKSIFLLLLFLTLNSFHWYDPILLDWNDLKMSDVSEIYNEEYDAYFFQANYNKQQLQLNNKEIEIFGHLEQFWVNDTTDAVICTDRNINLCYWSVEPDEFIALNGITYNEILINYRSKELKVSGNLKLNLNSDLFQSWYSLENVFLLDKE